jgi:hypothetical protein
MGSSLNPRKGVKGGEHDSGDESSGSVPPSGNRRDPNTSVVETLNRVSVGLEEPADQLAAGWAQAERGSFSNFPKLSEDRDVYVWTDMFVQRVQRERCREPWHALLDVLEGEQYAFASQAYTEGEDWKVTIEGLRQRYDQPSSAVKRCFECNSPHHLKRECPTRVLESNTIDLDERAIGNGERNHVTAVTGDVPLVLQVNVVDDRSEGRRDERGDGVTDAEPCEVQDEGGDPMGSSLNPRKGVKGGEHDSGDESSGSVPQRGTRKDPSTSVVETLNRVSVVLEEPADQLAAGWAQAERGSFSNFPKLSEDRDVYVSPGVLIEDRKTNGQVAGIQSVGRRSRRVGMRVLEGRSAKRRTGPFVRVRKLNDTI